MEREEAEGKLGVSIGGNVITAESGHQDSSQAPGKKTKKRCLSWRFGMLTARILVAFCTARSPKRQYCVSTAACQQRAVFV